MSDINRGLDPTGVEEEGYPKNGGSGGPHTQNSVKPETATRNKTDLRCRETIPDHSHRLKNRQLAQEA